jgi:hypothetical protein
MWLGHAHKDLTSQTSTPNSYEKTWNTGGEGFESVAVTKRSECVGGFGRCAEVDRCAGAFSQFQMSGNEIGVEMFGVAWGSTTTAVPVVSSPIR